MWSGYTGYDDEGNKLNPSIPTPEEKLKAKTKELEQQLAEQVAYGENIEIEARKPKMMLKLLYTPLRRAINRKPSQALVNKMKAEAIREFISHIKGMSDEDQKLKGRFQAELFWKGAFAVHEFGIDYAKQLEQTKT